MPKIVHEEMFDGAKELVDRLGFDELLNEIRSILQAFTLLVEEPRDANGAGKLRRLIDDEFTKAEGWKQKKTGGVDWIKRQAINARPRYICIGVEIQVSGRMARGLRSVRSRESRRAHEGWSSITAASERG